MAVALAASTGINAGAAGFNVPAATGAPVAGDLRMVLLGTSSSVTCTVPAGWTTLNNSVVGSGLLVVAYRVFQTGDAQVTFTLSASAQEAAEIVKVTGADATNIVIATNGGASSTSLVAPSVTPLVNNSLLLAFADVTAATSGTTETLSAPAGMTACTVIPGTSAAAHVANAFYESLTGTSATGTRTSTAAPVAGTWRAASVVIAPSGSSTAAPPGNFFPFLRF